MRFSRRLPDSTASIGLVRISRSTNGRPAPPLMTPSRSADDREAASSPASRRSARNDFLALLLFAALAVAHTWPLAQAPGTWSRNDVADTVLHEWTLAWVAHQLFASPLALFEANIF